MKSANGEATIPQVHFLEPEIVGHTKVSWYFTALTAAERIVREGGTFTSEELVAIVGMPPGHHNTVGSTVGAIARKLGLKSHGREFMKQKAKHRGKLERWGR